MMLGMWNTVMDTVIIIRTTVLARITRNYTESMGNALLVML